jgi:hypothetical protein
MEDGMKQWKAARKTREKDECAERVTRENA